MSGDNELYKLREDDVLKFLACSTHLGAANADFQMEQYVWKRRPDGTRIINVRKTWEKLLLAARAIAAIETPSDVCVISARQYGQRAILKFALHTGATAIAGRFTPGTFTNQIQKAFKEPRLLVVTDPRMDHQAIREASYVNIPVIAFCNTDSPVKLVDVAIPCNNKGQQSVGLMWWMLAREVLMIRGKINRTTGFMFENSKIMPDLYFYRDPEEVMQTEKEEAVDHTAEQQIEQDRWGQTIEAPAEPARTLEWTATDTMAPPAPTIGAPAPGVADFSVKPMDWAAETQQWASAGATGAQPASDWGGGTTQGWD